MSDDPKIPVLQDLLFRGQPEEEESQVNQTLDENIELEIAQDEQEVEVFIDQDTSLQVEQEEDLPEEISSDSEDLSLKELTLEEEIRVILDKQMDKAYKKIIHLIKQKRI